MCPVTDERHILVLPDRDAAEEIAEELGERFPRSPAPQLVREQLAGEDDAEDAQWLVVLEGSCADPRALAALAEGYEGWLERED